MVRKLFLCSLICSFLMLPAAALADTIDPDSFSATLGVGESVTITKTVTIDDAAPTEAEVDVYFLFDTTGSMGGAIDAAKASASAVVAGLSGYGNIAYGVGHYEDFPQNPYGGSGDTPFTETLAVPGTGAAAVTAIGALSLGYGNDGPESNLTALTDVAGGPWRDDTTRIVLWFGDAPGHEGDEPGYPGTATTASTITALNDNNVTVIGLEYGSFGYFDSTGQATAITDATDGQLLPGSTDPGDLTDIIIAAIGDVFEEYNEVTLQVSGGDPGVAVAIDPTAHTGDFDRSEEREFEFEVTFTGVTPGEYDFEIDALVDGGIVATETDDITVADGAVPEPATLLLLSFGLLGIGALGRKKR